MQKLQRRFSSSLLLTIACIRPRASTATAHVWQNSSDPRTALRQPARSLHEAINIGPRGSALLCGRMLRGRRTPAAAAHWSSEPSSETPVLQALLDRQDVEGKLVVMDAMHTQDLTAQKIVFERGGDYVFTVKKNQETLYDTLEKKLQAESFFSSAPGGDPSPAPGA
jgi:hypothetical protein